MNLEYFYVGDEYEFVFYRIPKELVKDQAWENITMEAKVLYSCMLDRQELSAKNGWHDESGRVFIYYTFDQICSDLHVSRKKAASMLDELENKAGLIERARQGQGRPNRIYVHRFHRRSYPQAVSNGNFKEYPMETSVSIRSELPGVSKRDLNNTDIKKTDKSETDLINQLDVIDKMRDYFEETCSFEILKQGDPYHAGELDAIKELLVETCTTTKPTIRISGEEKPAAVVKSRFEKLNSSHISYVMDRMNDTTTKITNIRQYLLAALFNAPVTIDHYYTTLVHHDMVYGPDQAEETEV